PSLSVTGSGQLRRAHRHCSVGVDGEVHFRGSDQIRRAALTDEFQFLDVREYDGPVRVDKAAEVFSGSLVRIQDVGGAARQSGAGAVEVRLQLFHGDVVAEHHVDRKGPAEGRQNVLTCAGVRDDGLLVDWHGRADDNRLGAGGESIQERDYAK